MLRKFGIIAVLSLFVTAIAAIPALAVAPSSVTQTGGLHVCEGSALAVTPTKTDTTAFLTATGEVCGAGTTATATLSANATVVTGCVNPGSKNQQPKGLERTTTTTAGTQTFNTRSGRGTVNVSTTGITLPGRTCPPPDEPVVVSVTFTDVTLTITSQTGTITATFPDIDP
jgi:hypothetical protein